MSMDCFADSEIPIVTEYFGDERAQPTVAQEFTPGRGWADTTNNERISGKLANSLRRNGVTAVALSYEGRLADFQIGELTSTRTYSRNLIR